MMNLRILVALLGASCLSVACGGDDGDGADSGPTADAAPVADSGPTADAESEPDAAVAPMELDAFCAEDGPLISALRRGASCVPFLNILQASDADLLSPERLVPLCRAQFVDFFDDGSVTLDESAIAACIDFIESSPCELVGQGAGLAPLHGTPCGLLLEGSYAEATTCDISAQCAGDSYCQELQNFGLPISCGTCRPRLDDGQPCSIDDECASASCNAAGVCADPVAQGGACNGDDDCQGALVCDPDTLLCTLTLPRQGDACTAHTDCFVSSFPDTKLYCDLDDTSTCQPLPGQGDACLQDIGTFDRLCNFYEYVWCDPVDDTCKAPATSGEGEPCNAFVSVGSGARRCNPGLACTQPFELDDDGGALGECFVPRAEGESCGLAGDGTDACQFPLSCENNLCRYQPGEYTGQCMGEELPN